MSTEQRLADLGITLPEVAAPVAAYVPAVLSGSYVYTAGQLPLVEGSLMATGRLGVDVDIDTAAACARVSALNGLAAVRSVIGSLDRVVRIVKVVGFVASDPSFTAQSAVVNGASEVLLDVFGDAGRHARSSVGMAVLPLNAPVEIELIVEVSA
jgi:enamine deaminase RidA (YjgF/YER057c/UK114 family)